MCQVHQRGISPRKVVMSKAGSLSSGNLLPVGKIRKKPDKYDSVINAMTYLFASVVSQGNKCREDHWPWEGGWFGKIPLATVERTGCSYKAKSGKEASFRNHGFGNKGISKNVFLRYNLPSLLLS